MRQGFKTVFLMERVMGIEPTLPAWKAGVLPLNYTRIIRFQTSETGLVKIDEIVDFYDFDGRDDRI